MPTADWAGDYGCDGNKVWVCGSFQYMWQATYFLQKLKAAYSQTSAIALVGVPDDLFCKANPSALVTVKTYDYTYSYDKTWTHSTGWRTNKCSTAVIDVAYKCPAAPPPPPKPTCNVCWEWTLSGCKDSYYKGDTCSQGLRKLKYVLDEINFGGE